MLMSDKKLNIAPMSHTGAVSPRLKKELDKGWASYVKNKKGHTLKSIFKSLGYEFK